MVLADRTGGKTMNTIYIIIRTIKGSNYSTILRTYQQNEKQKAKAELKLLRKGDIIYDYKLKEYQKVKKSGGNIMNINVEITGKIENKKQNRIGIQLYIKNKPVSYFSINIERKKILGEMNNATKNLLNIEDTFEDYMKLISDLGLEIPPTYKNHWTPTFGEDYFYVDSTGWVEREEFSDDTFENRLIANFNAFPTRELAELGCNVSKISRLALLWQYANDCVHTPDWSSTTKNNFHFSLDIASDKIGVDRAYLFKRDCIYFKTRKQAEAFVKMYNKELIRLMSIK